ncbi:hypothetical protein [Methylorubrum suomiense]|uniref:Uncharacterized protein n=2 Tax=Methylorubrum suomiense TaxID=144191 RepID=A0ABQ4V126_9HYPH|nr:hypothetical protein [Methylorubrum suomiense]GJE78117.1 hypothetical protein BGCPKDLD_4728 [Methylorubrum suomiense]
MLQTSCPTPGPSVYFGSGRRIDAYNFEAHDLPVPLIGRGLSRLARFGGAGDREISVAQHSYLLSFLVGPCQHQQRAALIHDVPELFTGEVPRPFKVLCEGIRQVDACCMGRLGHVFGVPAWAFDAIKPFDSRISYDERLFMFDHMEPADCEIAEENKLGIHIVPVTREVAATSWTRRFHRLFREEQTQ